MAVGTELAEGVEGVGVPFPPLPMGGVVLVVIGEVIGVVGPFVGQGVIDGSDVGTGVGVVCLPIMIPSSWLIILSKPPIISLFFFLLFL